MRCASKFTGRVWLVHGFNVTDGGAGTVGRLAPHFEAAGFEVKRFRYGWRGLLGVRATTGTFAQILADIVEEGDTVVGHSHGGCLAKLSADRGAPIAQLVLINAALDSDVAFAPQVHRVHVWHTPGDRPVALARLLPWHAWGDLGAVGYRGAYDRRVASYNTQNGFPIRCDGHSDIFTSPRLDYFAPLIVGKTLESHP